MPKEIGEDFSVDVKVDRFFLEKACQEHSNIFRVYSEKLAEAKEERNDAKDVLEYTKSKVEMKYRQMKEPPVKITEASVTSLVHTHAKVKDAKKDYTAASKAVDTYEAAVRALEHKKSMIDNLVKLWIAGYFSDPGRAQDDVAKNKSRSKLKRRGNDGEES